MKALFIIVALGLVLACKPEEPKRKKSASRADNQTYPDYNDPNYPGSGYTPPGSTATTATFKITKNGNDGYPTTLVGGTSKRVEWAFQIVKSSATASASYGNFKARLKNGYSVPGLSLSKSGGASFSGYMQSEIETRGSIQIEVIDIDQCTSTGSYGSSCNDDYTYPTALIQTISIPYQIASGLGSGSSSVTCAAIEAGSGVNTGNDFLDTILDIGGTILGRDNECD